ncbi:MAG: acyltransferase [Flavobacterium sp.]|nr:MAG: acyltransferase [Flavobacterium sp.]
MQKLDWVDALRGYAILGVICVHTLMDDQQVFLNKFWSTGHKGVELFFLVSAFTLLLSYNRRKEEDLNVGNFFIRRYFRIAPMFYFALVYFLIQDRNLPYPASYMQNASPSNIIAHSLLLNGVSPHWINSIVPGGWSVGVEVLFYMMCPFLFLKITNVKKAMLYYFISFIAGQILYFYLLANPLITDGIKWELFLYYYLPSHFFIFMLGFIAYYTTKMTIKEASKYIAVLVVSCVFFYAVLRLMPFANYKLINNNLMGIFFVLVINVLSRYSVPIIVNPLIRYLGKISFSVYLTHFAAMYVLNVFKLNELTQNHNQNFLIRLILVLVIAVPISTITYRLIEIPFQELGKKLIKKRLAYSKA